MRHWIWRGISSIEQQLSHGHILIQPLVQHHFMQMSVASSLLLACFILLSTFTGGSPLFIAVFLILGNVGQSFIVIALSNSVSRTLPNEQVGVGMGMLAMVNLISQGIAIGIYSKIVDLGSQGIPNWNPFLQLFIWLYFQQYLLRYSRIATGYSSDLLFLVWQKEAKEGCGLEGV